MILPHPLAKRTVIVRAEGSCFHVAAAFPAYAAIYNPCRQTAASHREERLFFRDPVSAFDRKGSAA